MGKYIVSKTKESLEKWVNKYTEYLNWIEANYVNPTYRINDPDLTELEYFELCERLSLYYEKYPDMWDYVKVPTMLWVRNRIAEEKEVVVLKTEDYYYIYDDFGEKLRKVLI